ncbi:hypothetical protein BD410DRAFT_762110 [Rickenella mellea]|uniref:Autophagy-related protein 2 n=1 Tax=Rickenella mellea TaxID=50990 RepID=A0A4Y7QI49_9AGAM|nr:hypothetical protein BD410DRAFT_762110 [Rickenella mellea]
MNEGAAADTGWAWLQRFPFNLAVPSFSLPSLSVPKSIQSRFISFVLKRSLGHLLKPGQLDANQIDSQIENGRVEIKDLELDSNALNTYIGHLPVRLQSGSLGLVTVRIPWPNPLSASVGLSISGVRLSFVNVPGTITSKSPDLSANLTDSVASVAETFMHDVLSPTEESKLISSVASLDQSMGVPPGSMDPFLTSDRHPVPESSVDPTGISVVASLIENLLARFELDMTDFEVVLTHAEHSSFTLAVSRIHYGTESEGDTIVKGVSEKDGGPVIGVTRSARMSGIAVSMCDLTRPQSQSPISTFSSQVATPGRDSDGSDIDENTMMMMSQSIVSLPARPQTPPSPSLSTTSTMYQSALSSTGRSRTPSPPSAPSHGRIDVNPDAGDRVSGFKHDLFFSLAEPITISLTTTTTTLPHPTNSANTAGSSYPTDIDTRNQGDKWELNIDIGVVASALRPKHIRGLLELMNAISPLPQENSSGVSQSSSNFANQFECIINIRGINVLLLSAASPCDEYTNEIPPSGNTNEGKSAMDEYFMKPLIPPHLSDTYVRVHLESVSLSHSMALSQSTQQSTSCTISDISVLSFRPVALSHTVQSSPVLITDPHLPSTYFTSTSHTSSKTDKEKSLSLPSFDIPDWSTAGGRGASVKQWRTKLPHRYSTDVEIGADGGLPVSPAHNAQALPHPTPSVPKDWRMQAISLDVTQQGMGRNINIRTLPFNCFVDMTSAGAILEFIREIEPTPQTSLSDPPHPSPTRLSQPQTRPARTYIAPGDYERGKERERLERLVLEDLNLEFDYRGTGHVGSKVPRAHERKASNKERYKREEPRIQLSVSIPFFRIQLRAPPPPGFQTRSGLFVLDFHTVRVTTGHLQLSEGQPKVTRFESDQESFSKPAISSDDELTVASIGFGELVIAYLAPGETKTTGLLSAGTLGSSHLEESYRNIGARSIGHQSASITIRSNLPTPSVPQQELKNTLIVELPAVRLCLSKMQFDGMQLWADDVAQLTERILNRGSTEKADISRDPSLIGSRFFAKRTGSSSSDIGSGAGRSQAGTSRRQILVKLSVSEVFSRIVLSPPADGSELNHLDIAASHLETLVEMKSEGENETILTVSVSDLTISEGLEVDKHTILSSIVSRNLNTASPPLLKAVFHSTVVPETTAKESRIKMSLDGFVYSVSPDLQWINSFLLFAKAPPGVFESVVPSERTRVSMKIMDGAIRATLDDHPSALLTYLGNFQFHTEIIGDSNEIALQFTVPALSILLTDDVRTLVDMSENSHTGVTWWKDAGYALLGDISDFNLEVAYDSKTKDTQVAISRLILHIHLCADSIAGIASFATNMQVAFKSSEESQLDGARPRNPTAVTQAVSGSGFLLDEHAFSRQVPETGHAPDMISDDLPTNPEYLDASFGAAAGLRELDDDDLDFTSEEDASGSETPTQPFETTGTVTRYGGETIKMLYSSIGIIEHFYENLPQNLTEDNSSAPETTFSVRIQGCDIRVFLYDGYDWNRTRRTIEEHVKEVRKRLAKLRQLLENGQTYDPNVEETGTLLFNSVYVGLDQDIDDTDPMAVIAAIDEELGEDMDTASQSSWQTFKPHGPSQPNVPSKRATRRKLGRARAPSVEFCLFGLTAEFDQYRPENLDVSRTLVTIRDIEILDHIRTSTWSKFLTELRSDSRGNVRETDSNMVRMELRNLHPAPHHPEQEARLKAKILPLRLFVDQDALDFMKKFFSFKDADADPPAPPENELYFQHVEVFPVDIKLDYKPRRVDYKALRYGKTIELMNFFHFDGAEMTLRHIALKGITGWARLGDTLNDLWTPDVKANQLADVISGVAPIRSVVNVGSGVADLVLLPIAQYKKDGRIIRGVQKGTTAFVKSTAVEAIKLGARLATGTQVILEKAEHVLGGQFTDSVTAEAVQVPSTGGRTDEDQEDLEPQDLISRYADQPLNIKEGMQSAYKTLSKNIISAGQTILAVPMEVYEGSGTEGPTRAVVRAVPIAVLKPMIGASGAISKTLLGLQNTLDPGILHENEDKYKH